MIPIETLRRYPFFAGLDEDILKQMAMLGEERELAAGEWLFHEGQDANMLYLLLDGSVKLTINADEKGERVEELSSHDAGDVIGWSALVPPHVYTLGAQATKKSRLAALDGSGLRILLDNNPVAGYYLLQNLTRVIGERLTNLRIQFVSVSVK